METTLYQKNKVCLSDYDYKKDIQNRILMAGFSVDEVAVLEEIIYSSTQFPLKTLAKRVGMKVEKLLPILDKFNSSGLFTLQKETITVNKEMRKYFETELMKFDEDFTPGMEFLQSLLKKVPIHVLPTWYPIPRTSNNIFASLIERYLKTPYTFQRHLSELDFENQILKGVINDLFSSPNHRLYAEEIRKKYALTQEAFQEIMLFLEFHFVCCLSYEKRKNTWVEVVTFFQEWKEYLFFIENHSPKKIEDPEKLLPLSAGEFPFAQDLSTLLTLAGKNELYVELDAKERWIFERQTISLISKKYKGFSLDSEEGQEQFFYYFSEIIQKLLLLKFGAIEGRRLVLLPKGHEWTTLPLHERALNLYKSTLSQYSFSEFPPEICTERNIHEIEKSINCIPEEAWVFLEDFLHSVVAPISDHSKMHIEKTGRLWKYTSPKYSKEELSLIEKITYEWFFEGGMIKKGDFQGKECLQVTSFGRTIFSS